VADAGWFVWLFDAVLAAAGAFDGAGAGSFAAWRVEHGGDGVQVLG
jgi:hypothetical protein